MALLSATETCASSRSTCESLLVSEGSRLFSCWAMNMAVAAGTSQQGVQSDAASDAHREHDNFVTIWYIMTAERHTFAMKGKG